MLREELDKAKKEYEEWVRDLDRIVLEEIKGRLDISKSNNQVQYYHSYKKDGKNVRKYIVKDKLDIAEKLANNKYISTLKDLAEFRLKQISQMSDYRNHEMDLIYEEMHPYKKALIKPVRATFRQRIIAWLKKESNHKNEYAINNEILTKNGEKVRSKSEKIIADMLFDLKIIYKYEAPLFLNKGLVLYPDFTILHPISLKEYYWEHHGMMDTPEYANKTLIKLSRYSDNGISIGDRLITSFESSEIPLNVKEIRTIIRDKFAR